MVPASEQVLSDTKFGVPPRFTTSYDGFETQRWIRGHLHGRPVAPHLEGNPLVNHEKTDIARLRAAPAAPIRVDTQSDDGGVRTLSPIFQIRKRSIEIS